MTDAKALISKGIRQCFSIWFYKCCSCGTWGRNKTFEISLERVESKLTQYNILSQEIGAANLTEVAVKAKALELTYTALYSTINKTNQLSLVNFIN